MQYIQETITGIDGTEAQFIGYVIDNSADIDPDRLRPAVLILPGGGYAFTSDREAEPIALQFVGAGYHAFVLRYSTAPSVYPTALVQAAAAMQLIRTHADEWHIKPDSIAVLGFSAGGHLAANLATAAGDEDIRQHSFNPDHVRPNALMLSYPVITSGKFAHRDSFDHLLGPDRKDDAAALHAVSIEEHIDAKTPPVFVWHTMPDELVPVENSLQLISACHAAGVSVEAHLYPEGGHGLSLGTEETIGVFGQDFDPPIRYVVPAVQSWIKLALDWFARTLG